MFKKIPIILFFLIGPWYIDPSSNLTSAFFVEILFFLQSSSPLMSGELITTASHFISAELTLNEKVNNEKSVIKNTFLILI